MMTRDRSGSDPTKPRSTIVKVRKRSNSELARIESKVKLLDSIVNGELTCSNVLFHCPQCFKWVNKDYSVKCENHNKERICRKCYTSEIDFKNLSISPGIPDLSPKTEENHSGFTPICSPITPSPMTWSIQSYFRPIA